MLLDRPNLLILLLQSVNIFRIGVGVGAIVALVLGDEHSAGQHSRRWT